MRIGRGGRREDAGLAGGRDLLSELDGFLKIRDEVGVGKIPDILVDALAGLV